MLIKLLLILVLKRIKVLIHIMGIKHMIKQELVLMKHIKLMVIIHIKQLVIKHIKLKELMKRLKLVLIQLELILMIISVLLI